MLANNYKTGLADVRQPTPIASFARRSQTPLGGGLDRFQRVLHFRHPLPRSIKNFVNDDRGIPGGGWRLALQEVHKIDFSSGIFSAIGPCPLLAARLY